MTAQDSKFQGTWLHSAVAVFATAVLVNYPWELAQSPFYRDQPAFPLRAWHCFVASLGDGLMVVFIWATGASVFRAYTWFLRPRASGYALMLGIGLLLALLIEEIALRTGRWSYQSGMPRWGEIGVLPVLQMLILPPLIFASIASARRRFTGGET